MGPNKKPSFKNKKRKVNLVFDEEKRRDFLTGFHKRKMQRKKQAQEKFERELADERKKLKREAKESYKKLVVSSRPIVGLEHLLEEEYGDDDVTVKITEITDEDIAKKCTTIGANKFKSDESNEEEIEEEDGDEVEEDEVPGMELKPSKVSKNDAIKEEETTFTSQKDIKKTLKKMATKNVKKSAVFQMKNDMERRKQKKKALKKKRENMKVKKKMFKKSHKKGSNK